MKIKSELLNKRSLNVSMGNIAFVIVRAVILIGLSFIIVYPIFVKLTTSLMSNSDLYNPSVVFLPNEPTLSNFRIVWNAVDYPKTFLFTITLCIITSVLQMVSCTLVAYGLARFKFFGKKLIMALVIVMLVVPVQMILTPLYIRFRFFDITQLIQVGGTLSGISFIDTPIPFILLSVTATGFKNGLYIFILLQHFRNSPKVLEEAAYIDGCTKFTTFTKIALPGAVAMLATIFLFAFVWQWNDYYYTSVFCPQLGLMSSELLNVDFSWIGGISSDYSFSASYAPRVLLLILPLIILYLFTQRFFVESVERSGIVG